MCLTAFSCMVVGFSWNLVHWCTAYSISGLVGPAARTSSGSCGTRCTDRVPVPDFCMMSTTVFVTVESKNFSESCLLWYLLYQVPVPGTQLLYDVNQHCFCDH